MLDNTHLLFVGFSAKDRYTVAESIVYHLKSYGMNIWYDRHNLLLGDNRKIKNLEEGIKTSNYACIIISENTLSSPCAVEEFSIVKEQFLKKKMTVFPVLYELKPTDIPSEFQWVKELIFKEVDRHSGTREICNHIACKISTDLLSHQKFKKIEDIIEANPENLSAVVSILHSYQKIDYANLNSRISLLYAAYLTIIDSVVLSDIPESNFIQKIFERLFCETALNLTVDYREIWLLENGLCLLANSLT